MHVKPICNSELYLGEGVNSCVPLCGPVMDLQHFSVSCPSHSDWWTWEPVITLIKICFYLAPVPVANLMFINIGKCEKKKSYLLYIITCVIAKFSRNKN